MYYFEKFIKLGNVRCLRTIIILTLLLGIYKTNAQHQPQRLFGSEIKITLKNKPSSWNLTFTLTPLDATRWDDERHLTTGYGTQTDALVSPNGNELLIDLVGSENIATLVIALGIYRISVNNSYIDVDWRTSDLYDGTSHGSPDMFFEYDVNRDCFTYVGEFDSINGTLINLWDWTSNYTNNKTNLEPYPPTSMSITNDSGHPCVTWSHGISSEYRTSYKVYRVVSSTYDPDITGYSLIADSLSPNSTSYTDQDYLIGWAYLWAYYKVKTVNSDRESELSDVACIDVLPAKKAIHDTTSNIMISKKDMLFQNYPNPFNPTTTISFYLATDSYITLKLYDLLGREISTLAQGIKSAGKNDVVFNASSLSSGIYFYKLTIGNNSITKKLLVSK